MLPISPDRTLGLLQLFGVAIIALSGLPWLGFVWRDAAKSQRLGVAVIVVGGVVSFGLVRILSSLLSLVGL